MPFGGWGCDLYGACGARGKGPGTTARHSQAARVHRDRFAPNFGSFFEFIQGSKKLGFFTSAYPKKKLGSAGRTQTKKWKKLGYFGGRKFLGSAGKKLGPAGWTQILKKKRVQGCTPTRQLVECSSQLARRVSLGGGVPLVGPQEDLRGLSGHTPRQFTSNSEREAK